MSWNFPTSEVPAGISQVLDCNIKTSIHPHSKFDYSPTAQPGLFRLLWGKIKWLFVQPWVTKTFEMTCSWELAHLFNPEQISHPRSFYAEAKDDTENSGKLMDRFVQGLNGIQSGGIHTKTAEGTCPWMPLRNSQSDIDIIIIACRAATQVSDTEW